MEKEKLDKMEEALRNTTAGKFAELGKAIQQCGVSLDDACKAAQELGKALNSVPPYSYQRRISVWVRGIIKTAIKIALVAMCLMFLIMLLLGYK